MAEHSQMAAGSAERGLSILVVEDNEVSQLLASIVLRNMGHTVSLANNGRECLNLLAAHRYDCIFMDIQMPELNGLDTTRYIRQEMNSGIPVIGVSADLFPEDIQKSRAAGMDDFIEKLYTEDRIRQVLEKWVR